jgi:hypothetical protein
VHPVIKAQKEQRNDKLNVQTTCDFKRYKNGFEALLDLPDARTADGARRSSAACCAWRMKVRQRAHAGARMRRFSSATPCACQFDASAAAKGLVNVRTEE